MSKQNYTIEEMQQQINQLLTTMDLPGIPPDEQAIYRATIDRIRQEIAKRLAEVPVVPGVPGVPPALAGATHHPPPPKKEIPIRVINTPLQVPTPVPPSVPPDLAGEKTSGEKTTVRVAPAKAGGTGVGTNVATSGIIDTTGTIQPPDPASINSTLQITTGPGAPTIDIVWSDGFKHIDLTESIARSRFTSILRDLEHSRFAKQNRLYKLPEYTGYSRAKAYYAALTVFWKVPPTLLQLNITRPTATYRAIFEMVSGECLT